MLCAIAEMHVWATSVNVLHPQVELACYVDDRLLYAPGPDAQECVQDAVATTLRYDTDAGWEWNEKGEVWSSRTPLQDPFDFQPHVGPEKDHVSMVGITLPVDIAQRDVAEGDSCFTASRKAETNAKAERQCKRITRGAGGHSFAARSRRQKLVAQLICPKLCW